MTRFTDLSRTTYQEYEQIARYAWSFFSPMKNKEMKEFLGIENPSRTTPLGADAFFNYLCKIDNEGYKNKIYKIIETLKLMEKARLLTLEGYGGSAILTGHYYNLKEMTNCQNGSPLIFGEAFGLGYLQYKLQKNVIHITGKNEEGDIRNGTGFLVNNEIVLTCKHVIEDMEPDKELCITDKKYEYEIKKHETKDVALLYLKEKVPSGYLFPALNCANILDEVLIMGYPPIPCTADAYLLSQKGEINSIVEDYVNRVENLIISSTTRPGNSGGPVISRSGYLVGMVTQYTAQKMSTDGKEEGLQIPYYMAIEGKTLYKCIKEMDQEVNVNFEDYQ